MPWFQVDDGLHAHPKTDKTTLAAMGLWTLAGSYCSAYRTDGQVPASWVRKRRGKQHARVLVDAGFWHESGHQCARCVQPRDPEGYVFHDWLHVQRPASEIERERSLARERQRKSRARRAESKVAADDA